MKITKKQFVLALVAGLLFGMAIHDATAEESLVGKVENCNVDITTKAECDARNGFSTDKIKLLMLINDVIRAAGWPNDIKVFRSVGSNRAMLVYEKPNNQGFVFVHLNYNRVEAINEQ